MTRPAMIMPYISDARVGDGYRPAFVLSQRADCATLYVPSKLAAVTVPLRAVEKARAVSYRPRVVRDQLLERVRLYRQKGRRFPRKPTMELLRLLGAGRATIDETVSIPPLPETITARERRSMQVERRAELADIASAIRAKIDMQSVELPAPLPRPYRARARFIHPDQLSLAL